MIAKFNGLIEALYRVLKAEDHVLHSPSMDLIKVHKLSSFHHRITQNTQYYHMAVSTVLYIFLPHLPKTIPQDRELENFTSLIFGQCAKKKELVQGAFSLLLYFDSDATIISEKRYIERLRGTPTTILSQVRTKVHGKESGP